jgi:hypothetical protein
MRIYQCLAAIATLTLAGAQTRIDLHTQSKAVDFADASLTKPSKTGTVLPPTCNSGETFFLTSAPAGSNWYGCASANTWAAQGTGVPYSAATQDMDLGNHSLHAQSISTGDGTASAGVILPELTLNGSNDTRIYAADSQASSGCIIWPVGMPTTGQAAVDTGLTATTTDGKTCRVLSWQTLAGATATFFSVNNQYVGNAADIQANTVTVIGIYLPYPVSTARLTVYVRTADGSGLYDFGLYGPCNANSTCARAVHTGAQPLAANVLPWLEGATTLASGRYYLAWTANSTVGSVDSGSGFPTFVTGTAGSSTGGALPSSITTPADGLSARAGGLLFALGN